MLLTSSPYLLLLALSCLLSIHPGQSQGLLTMPNINLNDKSYMLDMLLHSGFNNELHSMYAVQEMHSVWQGRSRLVIQPDRHQQVKRDPKKSSPVTIYADKERLLKVDLGESPKCVETNHDYVDELFNQNALTGIDSGHLIGAAKLLSFIQANSDKFIPLAPDTVKTNKLVYKQRFAAMFESGTTSEFVITLFYHEEVSMNLPNGIPRIIGIKTTSSGAVSMYAFNQYQPLKTGQIQASTSSVESVDQYRYSEADEVTLDMFAIDPSFGCSQALIRDQDRNEQLESPWFRFSFNARPSIYASVEPKVMTVIYDPILENLLVHQIFPMRSITRITDYRIRREYHILKRHSNLNAPNPFEDRIMQDSDEHSCIFSKIGRDPNNGNLHSLGKLLFGTNRLAYVGLARVRGIETRVYEYHDCDWPIWLQQPSVYEKNDPNQKLNVFGELPLTFRNDWEVMKRNGISMSNVFYFVKPVGPDVKEEHDLMQAKLLLVEIIFKDTKTGSIIRKKSIPIFEFEWGLPGSSPTGGRYEDSFSLQNDCLADVDNEEYSTISLLLETKTEASNMAWLQDRARRNLALAIVMQHDLWLQPISMLYDLESKLITGPEVTVPGNDEPLYPVSLEVTMKTAKRYEQVANLVFLGLGNVKPDSVTSLRVDSFRACFMIAAHTKADSLLFAYRAKSFECLRIKPEIFGAYAGADVGRIMKEITITVQSGTESLDELYLVQFHEETVHYGRNTLEHIKRSLDNYYHLHVHNPTGVNVIVKLDIKSAHVVRLDDKDSYDIDDLHLSDTNKFMGFGLVASDRQNKLVKLKEDADADDGQIDDELSFEHCKTACLADLDCRSFSVCHRQGKTSCIMSDVSFSTPSMALQMTLLTGNKTAKFGSVFPLVVDLDEQNHFRGGVQQTGAGSQSETETIQLMKHGACELHNKHYSDLFMLDEDILWRGISGYTILAAAHLEQCSELCYLDTLAYLRREKDLLVGSKDISADYTACEGFDYVDRETIDLLEPKQAEIFKRRLEQPLYPPEKVGGYCLREQHANRDDSDDQAFGRLSIKHYQFDFSTLYTKQYGISMAESPLSEAARNDLFLFKKDPKDIPEMVPNGNYGRDVFFGLPYFSNSHESLCAIKCFSPIWREAYPACKSFDIFEVINSRKEKSDMCAFNSITLADAIADNRTGLIRYGSDKQARVAVRPGDSVKVWHYELRPGLVADSVDVMYKIQLAEDIRAATAARFSQDQLHIGGFILFCGLVIVLSLGIALGLTLGPKILNGHQTVLGDTSQLIRGRVNTSELAELESANQKNAPGERMAASK